MHPGHVLNSADPVVRIAETRRKDAGSAGAPIAAKSDVRVPINCGLPKFDPKLWLA